MGADVIGPFLFAVVKLKNERGYKSLLIYALSDIILSLPN